MSVFRKRVVFGLSCLSALMLFGACTSGESGSSSDSVNAIVDPNCPRNFVTVPGNAYYDTKNFCVMKYEAKALHRQTGEHSARGCDTSKIPVSTTGVSTRINREACNSIDSALSAAQYKASSVASNRPWVQIARDDAIKACEAMGENYHLITNDQWQTMVRNIEMVERNWSEGKIGEKLSQGHSDNAPTQSLEAARNDDSGCYGTGQNCNGGTWNQQRRTHTLSNGYVVWDVAGNVSEWVRDDANYSRDDNYGPSSHISFLNVRLRFQEDDGSISRRRLHDTPASLLIGDEEGTPRKAKDQFGPSGNYSRVFSLPEDRANHANLGYFVSGLGDVVTRGGAYAGTLAGVFTADLTRALTSDRSAGGDAAGEGGIDRAAHQGETVGFRCVFDGELRSTASVANSPSDPNCPENFITVPGNNDYGEKEFCVMKYEAKAVKKDGGDGTDENAARGCATEGCSGNNAALDPDDYQVAAMADHRPWVAINRDEAEAACQAMGDDGGYDLITNKQWQTLARNIELHAINWSGGEVASGGLSHGHADANPDRTLAASDNNNEACYGTGSACDGDTWDKQKRTHTLSNGNVIWDVAGNVFEWVKDVNSNGNNTFDYGSDGYISAMDPTNPTTHSLYIGSVADSDQRNIKNQFGPHRATGSTGDYRDEAGFGDYSNLGYFWAGNASGTPQSGVCRGGSWRSRSTSGVFSASLYNAATARPRNIGFRCVYRQP